MFQSIKNIVFFTAFLVSFLACSTYNKENKQVFRYNEPTGIASLDPAFAKNQSILWAVNQLYNSLVETDSNLQVKPSLAKSWEISEDLMTYRFQLRTDVFFHDNPGFSDGKGRKMIAADVVYSFKRIMNPATASPGAWIFNNRVDTSNGFSAIDDSTFQLKLLRPFSPILGVLSNKYCSIVPKEVIQFYGKDFRSHPCGTGPFQFKTWEEGQSLILLRNDHYFEKDEAGQSLPYLDAVKISFNDSRATEFLQFRQGELDFLNDIDPSFKDEVLNKKGQLRKDWEGKIILQKHAYLNTEYLGIVVDTANELVKQSPLRVKKIRQAINYGFDRKKLMFYLRNSIGTAAESGFVPAGLPSFDTSAVKGYQFEPEKARRLLQEAGYDKKGPAIKLLTIPIYADLGNFIAKQLEEIGMKVEVEVIPKSLLLEQTAQSKALFFRASWIADYPDAENYLSVFYGKNPAPPNYTRFKNPAFDELYEKAMLVTSDSIRYRLYQDMDRIIIDEAPVVPLWYDQVIHLVQPNVKGFMANGLNLLELRKVRK